MKIRLLMSFGNKNVVYREVYMVSGYKTGYIRILNFGHITQPECQLESHQSIQKSERKPLLIPQCGKTTFETLTIFRLGSQLLHSIYAVNGDAPGDVWPAGGFTVHNDNVLQPRHVAQYGLRGRDRCRGLRCFGTSLKMLVYHNGTHDMHL